MYQLEGKTKVSRTGHSLHCMTCRRMDDHWLVTRFWDLLCPAWAATLTCYSLVDASREGKTKNVYYGTERSVGTMCGSMLLVPSLPGTVQRIPSGNTVCLGNPVHYRQWQQPCALISRLLTVHSSLINSPNVGRDTLDLWQTDSPLPKCL